MYPSPSFKMIYSWPILCVICISPLSPSLPHLSYFEANPRFLYHLICRYLSMYCRNQMNVWNTYNEALGPSLFSKTVLALWFTQLLKSKSAGVFLKPPFLSPSDSYWTNLWKASQYDLLLASPLTCPPSHFLYDLSLFTPAPLYPVLYCSMQKLGL